jgi:hypothetical protein
MEKPYKGTIDHWEAVHFSRDLDPELWIKSLGYYIIGIPHKHPDFPGSNRIRTSVVIKHNRITGYIETLNSRYQLLNPKGSKRNA